MWPDMPICYFSQKRITEQDLKTSNKTLILMYSVNHGQETLFVHLIVQNDDAVLTNKYAHLLYRDRDLFFYPMDMLRSVRVWAKNKLFKQSPDVFGVCYCLVFGYIIIF